MVIQFTKSEHTFNKESVQNHLRNSRYCAHAAREDSRKPGECRQWKSRGRCSDGDNCPYVNSHTYEAKRQAEKRNCERRNSGSRRSQRSYSNQRRRSQSYRGRPNSNGRARRYNKRTPPPARRNRSYSRNNSRHRSRDRSNSRRRSNSSGSRRSSRQRSPESYPASDAKTIKQPTRGKASNGEKNKPLCKAYSEGKCSKCGECDHWHPGTCQFHKDSTCKLGEACVYTHRDNSRARSANDGELAVDPEDQNAMARVQDESQQVEIVTEIVTETRNPRKAHVRKTRRAARVRASEQRN